MYRTAKPLRFGICVFFAVALKWRKQEADDVTVCSNGAHGSQLCVCVCLSVYYFNNNLYTLFLTYLLLFVECFFFLSKNWNGFATNRTQTHAHIDPKIINGFFVVSSDLFASFILHANV